MNWPECLHAGAARWIAGGSVFVGAAGIILGQTLLSPAYAILYSSDMSTAQCVAVENRQLCNFAYGFSLSNTGTKMQDGVRIEWPLDMQHLGLEASVSDVVASAQPTPQPQILPAFEADKTVYTINGLMPNVMVRIWLRCVACTPAQAQALREAPANIQARGVVAEGNPRVSALLNAAMNVLRLFGLFS